MVEPVGDGNINWVRRVRSAGSSWVVKQARPTLERFPEYRASTERIGFEARFYETVAGCDAPSDAGIVVCAPTPAWVSVLKHIMNAATSRRS